MAASRWCRFTVFLLFLLSCQPARDKETFTSRPSITLDLAGIRQRGYLQAIIDNNSISYFIYKGTTMGYEYELLTRLANYLKVDLKIKVISGIEEGIRALNSGEGDVLAFPLTLTQDRAQYLSFTDTHYTTHQVLVQKKPTNWRMQPPMVVEKKLIRTPVELIGKEVYVMKGSSFFSTHEQPFAGNWRKNNCS